MLPVHHCRLPITTVIFYKAFYWFSILVKYSFGRFVFGGVFFDGVLGAVSVEQLLLVVFLMDQLVPVRAPVIGGSNLAEYLVQFGQ